MLRENVTLQQLRYLLAVADRGTFRLAGVIGRGQPAVSKGIRDLEQNLGAPLFEPGDRTRLTSFGRKVLSIARRALAELETLAQLSADEAAGLGASGGFRIGTKRALAEMLLPEYLAAFRRKFPAASVRIRGGSGSDLMRLLTEGEVDLTLSHGRSRPPNVEFLPLMKVRRVVVAGRKHPVIREKRLTPALLARHPLILPGWNTGTHREVTERLAAYAPAPGLVVAMEVQGADTRVHYAALGWGVAVVERGFHAKLPRNLVAREVPDEILPLRTIGLYWLRDRYLSQAAQSFIQMLREKLTAAG